MVKGITKQVIVVNSPHEDIFDQAIFILKDDAVKEGVTDEMLLKSANKLLASASPEKKISIAHYGAVWACAGALLTGLAWFLTVLI